jgi:hypothetical protein
MEIKYLSGHDVREPIGSGRKIICHVVNDLGVMGAGVAKALYSKWPRVKSKYQNWHLTGINIKDRFELGKVQMVFVEDEIVVANIIGQHGVGRHNGKNPIRYNSLRDGFRYVKKACGYYEASIHLPYLIGCGLAGGKWDKVEKIIREELSNFGIEVNVYDLFNARGVE